MKKLISCLLLFGLYLGACDKVPDEVYEPPVLSGTAFVLAAADHIAVVNLQLQELSRIKIDKKGVDLAAAGSGVYVLSKDGYLAFLTGAKSKTSNWKKVLGRGVALASGDDGALWLLGEKEIVLLSKGGDVVRRHPLSESASSIIFDGEHHRVWLMSRERGTASPVDTETFVAGNVIEQLGNSVHQGFALAGTNQLWIAEGNEYMDGKPYGVGFAQNGPAMAGGLNIFESDTGKQVDFVLIGGNVVDMVVGPEKAKVYAAVSRLNDYAEATLSVLGSDNKRVLAELRLCLACHDTEGVEIKGGQAEVLAVAILWSTVDGGK